MFARNTQRLTICFCSERSDIIISSGAKRERSLLTARGLSHLQNSENWMPYKYFYICLVSANDVMEHFAFPGNIDFQFAPSNPPQASPNPFRPKSTWSPPPHREIALDTFLDAVEHDLRTVKPEPVRDNLTSRERHALKSLKKRNDIFIQSADKGSATVLMDRDWYINECLRQLNDTKFYRPLDNDITDDIQKRVQVYVERMLHDKIIDHN